MKEERTAGLLVSETFCLALVSDTFGCNKALGATELSSQYLSKDLDIYIYMTLQMAVTTAATLKMKNT